MPTPIRTQVIAAIQTALSTISELATVERFQPRPVDLGLTPTPACFIYDSSVEQLSRQNRYLQGELELALAVFISLTNTDESTGGMEFSDSADIIQAEIHAALQTLPNTGLILQVVEVSSEREITNPSWGVLTYTITVTYRHQFGNGYTLNDE